MRIFKTKSSEVYFYGMPLLLHIVMRFSTQIGKFTKNNILK